MPGADLLKKLFIGAGAVTAAGAATLATPEESEAITLPKPVPAAITKVSKAGKESRSFSSFLDELQKSWEPSSTSRALEGQWWGTKKIKAVMKPKSIEGGANFPPDSPYYKKPIESDKRVVLFDDKTYNMLDKEDLQTVVSGLGLREYMKKLPPETNTKGRIMALERSIEMRNQMHQAHDTLESASKARKKYAQDQFDLFGEQAIGVETVGINGKFYNLPSPYADILVQTKDIALAKALQAAKTYREGQVPRRILEIINELSSIKFYQNQYTVKSKFVKSGGRDWSKVPANWANIGKGGYYQNGE